MRHINELNKDWKFQKLSSDVNESSYIIEAGEQVTIPHTWNDNGNVDRIKTVYQRKLSIEKELKNQCLFLEFLGANSVCRVYLNDNFLGEHRGGYSTFRFNITDCYDWESENVLTVYVDNSETKDVSPLMGDFTIYGGLYRGVNLVSTSKNHFDMEYWGTSGVIVQTHVNEAGTGVVDLKLHTIAEDGTQIRVELFDANGTVVKTWTGEKSVANVQTEMGEKSAANVLEREKSITSVQFEIEHPDLWNGKESPALYHLEAYLEKDGEMSDQVELPFGFRKVEFTADKGFYLNGEHQLICGVAKHQDFENIGNAISKQHMEQDMALIDEIGANAVRLSHYQHDQHTYDLCDQQGFLVWAEIPMLLMPQNDGVMENAMNQLHELVLQNIHHPSIIMWGVQNEIAMHGESIAMYQGVQQLNDCVHDLAPHAVTTSANMYYVKNNSQLNSITDVQGYNLYHGWYYGEEKGLGTWLDTFHADHPKMPIGISEYGADCNLAFHSDAPKVKDYTEEFQALYHEKSYAEIKSRDYVWGSFVWNMFDFGSFVRKEGGSVGKNNKGLVTFDRKTKKDAFYYYKANWSKDAFVHICEKRFVNRHTEQITIKVYSNCEKVSLYVNEQLLGEATGVNQTFIFKDVALTKGENKIMACAGDVKDDAVFMLCEQEDKSYVFVDPNPGINVANWFTQKEGEVDCFPEGCFSILDTIGDLLENEEAWSIVREMVPKATERATKGAPVTLLWVLNKLRGLYTEDEVKALNERLVKVHK